MPRARKPKVETEEPQRKPNKLVSVIKSFFR